MHTQDFEYVGFWPRLGAAVIDLLLQLLITLALTYLIYGQLWAPGQRFMGISDVLINVFLPATLIITLWVYTGSTPGKQALSARIVDAKTGAPLTTGQSVIRYVGYFVSLLALGLGYFWIALDRKKQGWHDKMARSVVVRPARKEAVKFALTKTDAGAGERAVSSKHPKE